MKLPSLNIAVDEIPDPGLVRTGELPAEWLGDSVLDAYSPSGPVRFELNVRRLEANVLLEGELELELTFQCSRTLERGVSHLTVRLSELFQPADAHALKFGGGLDTEELGDEIYTYEGSTIDLEPYIREQLVLAQDPYPVVDARPSGDTGDNTERAVWTSDGGAVDPRWQALKDLKIN